MMQRLQSVSAPRHRTSLSSVFCVRLTSSVQREAWEVKLTSSEAHEPPKLEVRRTPIERCPLRSSVRCPSHVGTRRCKRAILEAAAQCCSERRLHLAPSGQQIESGFWEIWDT